MTRMLYTLLILVSVEACAQTQDPKRAAIVELNKYFQVKYDPVEEYTTITREMKPNSDALPEVDLICFVSKTNPVPTLVHLRIFSVSEDWKYLDYSRFILKWDNGGVIDLNELEHHGKIIDGGVIEQMWVDIPLKQFKQIATAQSVVGKIGTKRFEFTKETRSTWCVLCHYFDVISTTNPPPFAAGSK